MEYLQLIVIVGAIFGFYYGLQYLDKRQAKRTAVRLEEYMKSNRSDESVSKTQAEFESRLHKDLDLPDSIRGRPAYIYWNLMRPWFASLIAKHRYDEAMVDKIKTDWLNYMHLLESRSTLQLLSLSNTVSEDKQEEHEKEWRAESQQIELIENGMAAAIGDEAIQQLQDVRSREHDAFDHSGTKPMAPVGYHYFPTSFRPHVEELVPDKMAARSEIDLSPKK